MTSFNVKSFKREIFGVIHGTNVLENQVNIPRFTVTRQRVPTLKNTFHEAFNIRMLTKRRLT